ncbi:MAG: PD-(D/E)XK nuclease family protein [Sedimentisphaerales bacterium]|jgi:hypothetical protein
MGKKKTFTERLLGLLSEPAFIKFANILGEPNVFKIVGRSHYERWHSCFWGWLLDSEGTHLLSTYVLKRFLLLLLDEKCLKDEGHSISKIVNLLPTIEFANVEVSPNEYTPSETSVRDIGRFDIFLTADYKAANGKPKRLNVIFELKIDSPTDGKQSKRYADWLWKNHPNDNNLLIYVVPKLLSDSKATTGDKRWYCMDYQILHDKLLVPILDHPNLNEKVKPFIIQYIKNLKTAHRGIKMAITDQEKSLALELYEKYSDVFDSIFDALQADGVIDYTTADITARGRETGKIAVKVDGHVFEGPMLRTLYEKILKYIVDKGYLSRIALPWGTGRSRYILSNEKTPKHPNGRDFFNPVRYRGYAMESHYDRRRGLIVLDSLCKKLEIEYEPIDV